MKLSSPQKYLEQLHVLIDKAKIYSSKILFVGLTPCQETKTTPPSWGDHVYTNARIWEFELALRTFCVAQQIPIVEVFETFQAEHTKNDLLPDGLHPNDAGHQLIANFVQPQLDQLLQK